MALPASTPSKQEYKDGSAQRSNPQPEEMARSSSTRDPPPTPSWFTPKRLLIIFCVINMINYVDRGAIASNGVNGSIRTCDDKGICTSGSGIQGEFDLTNFQDGLLSSAFMVGLLVASPIFASLAKSHNPFRLIGVGLSVWTLAAAGCGSAFSFWFIAICRMLVGVGEASFISLAAPFIDDNAPISQKTAWLAMFYMCIPTGVALGYVYGGFVGGHFHWRYAFWGEALLMLPFAVLGFVVKPLQLKGFSPVESKKALTSVETVSAITDDSEASKLNGHILVGGDGISADELNKTSKSVGIRNILNQFSRFARDMKVLLVDKVYVVNVFGYIAYNFVIGAYSYWGPKAGYNIYHMKSADMMFGGITIVCGILGTLSGGFILDRMSATISNAFILLSGATFLGAIFCFVAFCVRSLYGFIVLFAVGELLVFATQAPVNYVCLHCVKPSLRPLSMAISTVSIHIFGDVPSSPLVGVLQDNINNWRETALILTSIFFLAAGIWFIGVFLHSVDKSNDESESQVSAPTMANRKPLLDGNGDESFCEV
ncbi:probable sphingolipid transporter spinster homolog 2 isoform X1 [Durio zibethinus]|uniref:Probable sphingolipid transporter spinster homolog 2 isoform X1 n=1 Tax=Durio zibethinus TaxID=66656 RepID=A0A6P5YIU7_DURZI|nr:probable sphingolipid transporter spinster homolog 2 isoform X1 [Durio zibethinus]XP_022740273.1 probable sphingolipid transporter spinster homolog 2 isoform X1 [Durio zibethinus]